MVSLIKASLLALLLAASLSAQEPTLPELRTKAEQGAADAQSKLGFMYATGNVMVKDELEAYKWWLLAEAQGEEGAKGNILIIEGWLTADQRADGRRLAREFKPVKQ